MQVNYQPFDIQRMFLGSTSWLILLEVVVRTLIMYLVALLAARLIGKRGMGNLTPFEFIVVITLGSAAGTPVVEIDVPLLHGIMVLLTVVAVDTMLARFTHRSVKLERALNAQPAVLVKNGKILEENTAREKVSDDELMMMLRLEGVRNLSEVEFAFMEPSGKLSIFLMEDKEAEKEKEKEREKEKGKGQEQQADEGGAWDPKRIERGSTLPDAVAS